MAVMEVILRQSYAGQECLNRWNYIGSGVPATVSLSFALASALGAIHDALLPGNGYPATGLMNLIAGIQHNSVTFESLMVRSVYSVTDFYEAPFVQPLVGASAGEGMSPAVAFGFFTNRVRTDVRRATKRFTGVPEADVSSQGIIAAGIAGELTALAVKMSTVQTYDDEGNTLSFAPAVCGKEPYEPQPGVFTPPRLAYRYWPTDAIQMTHTAQGIAWDWYPQVRTQTSRQYGRGR